MLPNLPKLKRKREQELTPKVLAYFRSHYPRTCAIEIKQTSGNSIATSALAPHQKLALMDATSTRGLTHKIMDAGRRNPFDAFKIANAEAYVVACFTAHGYCLAIPIRDWNGANTQSPYAFKIPLT